MQRPSPQLLSFRTFCASAMVVPLLNHGRTAEVLFQGTGIGFVDSVGETGLRQAHRAEVNNALFFNQPMVSPQHFVAPPPAVVLQEYPELRERFPAEYDFLMAHPDLEIELLRLKEIKVFGETLNDYEAVAQLQHMSVDSATDLLVVRCPGNQLTLRACGVGNGSSCYFEWLWPDGDPHGDVMDAIPSTVLSIVRNVVASADL